MGLENKPSESGERAPLHHLELEDGLERLHMMVDGARHHAPESVAEAQNVIHETEDGLEYDRHENGQILTVEHLEVSIENVQHSLSEVLKEDLEDEERTKIIAHLKLLSSRASEIISASTRYAQSVERFARIKKQQFRKTPEDFQDELQKTDVARRNNHERLIEALRVYNANVRWFKNEGYLEGVSLNEWHEGINVNAPQKLVETKPASVVYVFPESFLSDRRAIQSWGIAEVFRSSVKDISAEIKKARPE